MVRYFNTAMRTLACGILVAGVNWTNAQAAVPGHLAQMAASIYKQTQDDMRSSAGEDGRGYAVAKALAYLDAQRMGNWSVSPVTFPNLERLAEVLGLDLAQPEDRDALAALLDAQAEGTLDQALGQELARQGKPAEESDIKALREAFDAAWNSIFSEVPTSHVLEQSDSPERLVMDWQPRIHAFEMLYQHAGDEWNAPMSTVLRGDVRPRPDAESGTFRIEPQPAESAIVPYSPADLSAISTQIYGTWYDGESVWMIAKADGSVPDQDTDAPAPVSVAEQIHEKEEQIEALESERLYIWLNPETEEEERQTRFRRLDDPWVYQGEQLAQPGAEERIAALEAEIAELRSTVDQVAPIERDDPVGFEDESPISEPLRITVRDTERGYSFTYDEARFDGRFIKARRVLRDVRDIEDLPQIIINGLIASWSPPEWIELEAELNRDTGALRLTGPLYRLHVTYPLIFGEPTGEIEGIHTPFVERTLTLLPDQRKAP